MAPSYLLPSVQHLSKECYIPLHVFMTCAVPTINNTQLVPSLITPWPHVLYTPSSLTVVVGSIHA